MCSLKASDPGKTGMITERMIEMKQEIASPVHKMDAAEQNSLEPELQDHIGIQLRAVYDEILNEPVPARFLELLAELERKQAKRP